MTPAEQAVKALTGWLEQESGLSHVRKLVRRYGGERIRQGAVGVYLAHQFGSAPEGLMDDMVQEFMQYLFQVFLPQLSSRPDQVSAILNGQARYTLKFAWEQFFWRLQDRARKKDINPRAYLHRRVREVLRQDRRFVLHRDELNNLSFSSAAETKEVRYDHGPFAQFEYGRWAAPPEPGSRDGVFTAKYLAAAALFYLQGAAVHLPEATPIPVRELVRYLAAHHGWLDRLQPESLVDDLIATAGTEAMEDKVGLIAASESISVVAAQFATGMDEMARRIFFWTLDDPPVSFQKIAERLDLPNHNHPYRIHRKTIVDLKYFTSNWPGSPLHELPEEVGLVFIEELRNICKKSVVRP